MVTLMVHATKFENESSDLLKDFLLSPEKRFVKNSDLVEKIVMCPKMKTNRKTHTSNASGPLSLSFLVFSWLELTFEHLQRQSKNVYVYDFFPLKIKLALGSQRA